MRLATRIWLSALLIVALGLVGSGAAGPSGRPSASAVTAGIEHTCALTRSGAVKCWGYNGHDELGVGDGSGSLAASSVPLDVYGLSGVTAISAGTRHSCALTSNGGVKCWGVNYGGALGDGTEDRHYAPVDVVGLGSGVKAVSAGYDRSCAVLATGGVKCWGTDYGLNPVDIPGLSSGVVDVSQSYFVGCALMSTGGVKCWGLHYGATAVDVPGLESVKAVTTGGPYCALTVGGAVKCWGFDNNWTPTEVPDLGSGVAALATGTGHACALMSTGGVKCWGSNEYGELGNGTTVDSETPVNVVGLSSGMSAIGTGGFHSCAVSRAGALKCWGDNGAGDLGDGTMVRRLRPVDVFGIGPPLVRCVVPNVFGKRLAAARTKILRAHCLVGRLAKVASTRSKNIVVGQSPRAGRRMTVGSKVKLVVSRG
jgi:hypothetical protein